MTLEKKVKVITIKDPFQNFNESQRICEIRYCPLTGRITRIIGLSLKEFSSQDNSQMIEESSKTCPFCPHLIEAITPRFLPPFQETYTYGNARCFPNAFPYDENNAVVTITHQHYVPINEFTFNMLFEAFQCALLFFKDLDNTAFPYQSINWNYMPTAGSSLIHPHLQIIASSTPSSYQSAVLSHLSRDEKLFTNYLTIEIENEERVIAHKNDITWLVAFAPLGQFDIIGILNNFLPFQHFKNEFDSIIQFILKILDYFAHKKINSFNMSIHNVTDCTSFLPHIRIVPRVVYPPYATSEINYLQMIHCDAFTLVQPELIAQELKKFILTNNS